MVKSREALLIAAIGRKAVGKSEATLIAILNYVKGNPARGIKPAKALLCDVNEEFAVVNLKSIKKTAKIRTLGMHDVSWFRRQTLAEARRIRFFNEDGSPMTLDEVADAIYYIMRDFKDGLILLEDPLRYMGSPKKDIIGMIATTRHRSTDCYVHYQMWRPILNAKIWGNLNVIRLHATVDSVDMYKYDMGDRYEICRIAESAVNLKVKAGNPRFFLYINVEDMKITGNFTEQEFQQAIDAHIATSYKKSIKPMLDMRDNGGKIMYNNETAHRATRQRMFDEYYGNLD